MIEHTVVSSNVHTHTLMHGITCTRLLHIQGAHISLLEFSDSESFNGPSSGPPAMSGRVLEEVEKRSSRERKRGYLEVVRSSSVASSANTEREREQSVSAAAVNWIVASLCWQQFDVNNSRTNNNVIDFPAAFASSSLLTGLARVCVC